MRVCFSIVLTALGALRSEFPSRKTGLTAEPKILNIWFVFFFPHRFEVLLKVW
jgi:hypothetical protein